MSQSSAPAAGAPSPALAKPAAPAASQPAAKPADTPAAATADTGASLPELLAAQRAAEGGEAPATGPARSYTMVNGQKMFTNLTDNSAAEAGLSAKVGMQPPGQSPGQPSVGNPNLGTAADNLRQIQNIQKLSASTPQGGSSVLEDGNAAANAEKAKRWELEKMMDRMNRGGSRQDRANIGRIITTMMSGQDQQEVAALQAGTQRRGQDLGVETARAGHNVQIRGQDLMAESSAGQLGLGMRRLDQASAEGEADRNVRLQIAEQQAALEGRRLTAAEKAAVLRPKWVMNPMQPGMVYNETAAVPQQYSLSQIGEEPKKK